MWTLYAAQPNTVLQISDRSALRYFTKGGERGLGGGGGGPRKTSTAGKVPKMESRRSPRLMAGNCSRLRLYELMVIDSTCSAAGMDGAVLMAGEGTSVTTGFPPAGKFTPRSMLPEGLLPNTALQKERQSCS